MTYPPIPNEPRPEAEPPAYEPQSYDPPKVAELPGSYEQPPIEPVAEQPSPYGQEAYGPAPAAPQQQPQYGQPPYTQQAYGQPYGQPHNPYSPYAPQQRNSENGLAIGALVCSILGLCSCVTALPGLIMGHIALAKANRGEAGGRGLALAAVIVGYVVVALTVGFTTTLIILGANGQLD
ncbi:DUF4190 domain-containing protein [Amycolatopsis sp. H20-H5]|uniref:DUF4190 domain-containing protein n=1 Tax=Amycolatopsis sp. H20-H5 TaxID=3046309 RepID=UPI002DB94A8B|nr:DUF4190 domain-containing protein [Amycolatopsis sp. H20-H5]MEC3979713.1 DUF4190 domain-containing protein [Amycolatopsis sp. H20-H5]